jgi:SAM-dependent methyltransferase
MTVKVNKTEHEALKSELQPQYERRFAKQHSYRNDVWKILATEYFQKFISKDAILLDLGCGWGEFINNIEAKKKFGMDLNPEGKNRLAASVEFLEQDCSNEWPLPSNSLDCVFTSNFFEHLYGKDDLRRTLTQIYRCLRPGGRLICMGPNIRYLGGAYWDFWDHYLPLTERSLEEGLELLGFRVERSLSRFLPYKMTVGRTVPLFLVRLYLRLPLAWHFFGKQFLVISTVPDKD